MPLPPRPTPPHPPCHVLSYAPVMLNACAGTLDVVEGRLPIVHAGNEDRDPTAVIVTLRPRAVYVDDPRRCEMVAQTSEEAEYSPQPNTDVAAVGQPASCTGQRTMTDAPGARPRLAKVVVHVGKTVESNCAFAELKTAASVTSAAPSAARRMTPRLKNRERAMFRKSVATDFASLSLVIAWVLWDRPRGTKCPRLL
jgi:hypothetical protein